MHTPARLPKPLTSAAGVANGDPEGEIRLVGLALGFEKVVTRALFPYSGPILLQKADRGLGSGWLPAFALYWGRGTDLFITFPLSAPTWPSTTIIRPMHTMGDTGSRKPQAATGWGQSGGEAGWESRAHCPRASGESTVPVSLGAGGRYPSAGWKCMSPDTVQARNPVPTKCTECGGHKAQCPSAVWEPGQPQLAKAGGSGHCWGACREPRPTTPVLAGNNPQARCMLGPRRHSLRTAPSFAPQGSVPGVAHLGSPQPVVVPEPRSSSLIPLPSVPAGATVTAASTRPTADELGPGPSPKSRPVGPAAGHAGIWSPRPPDSMSLHQEGELSAPQPSAWFVQAGSTAFWEEWTLPLSLPGSWRGGFLFVFFFYF